MRCPRYKDPTEYVKRIEIRFLRDELLYDIAQMGFIEADVMRTEDEHQKHPTADVIEDGNRDMITRSLTKAFAEVRHALYPFTEEASEEGDWLDDSLTEPDEYVLYMKVPEGFAMSTHALLMNLVHDFLVSRTLSEYLMMTYPEKQGAYYQRSELALQKINGALVNRMTRVRRASRPW